MKNLDAFKEHGDVIWNIANLLRGPYRPPQYRRVMIPLTVLRRLDCVLEKTKDDVVAMHKKLKAETRNEKDKETGKEKTVPKYDAETIEKMINRKFDLTFHNTSEFTFQKLLGDPDKLAPNLLKFMSGFSTRARKIVEKFNFADEIEKLEEANRLFEVVKKVAAVDLHPNTIPNIAMGYVFEDLVRRFNEQANEEAGDHFTPRDVIKLMVSLLFTYDDLVYKEGKVIKVYDPTAGTGGMLSESEKLIVDPASGLNPSANLELFGQEYNPEAYAICGSDLMIKGEDVKNIVYGNTLGTGKAKEGFVDGDGHPDERFHYMLANPPFGVEWKPEKDHVTTEHEQFGLKGRFGPGLPRINDGALLFLLHMISKMEPAPKEGEGSRIGIVFLPFEYVRLTRQARLYRDIQRDVSPAERDAQQSEGLPTQPNLVPRTASPVERALGAYAEASGRIANGLYTRAGIYLIVGVLIAFSGLFFFYVQTNAMQQQELKRQQVNLEIATKAAAPKPGVDESAGTLLLSRVAELAPRFGILFFIEFVAFFFLRQYRSAMDEFRYFEAVKRCREEVLALVLLSKETSTIDLAKVVESGRFFSSAGKLAAGETTELIETRKLTKDEMALFEQIVSLISSSKRTN